MKRNKVLLILSFFVAFSSCKKLIEIEDTDLLAGERALSQITFAEQAVLGAYAALNPDMNILMNATFSDELQKAEFYNAVTTHEWQYGPADVGLRDNFTAIAPNYVIINRANLVLAALPTSDSTKLGDNQKRARLKGDCHFLRAWGHFELFRYYSGNYDPNGLAMPYMESSSIANAPRIKMGPYFEKLKADLALAKTLVPNNISDINRANVAAVAGLQARVALYMRDWAAAETFATEFINAVPLASLNNFPGIWRDSSALEIAFQQVRTTSAGGRLGSLFRATSASTTCTAMNGALIGLITWRPSDELWDSYDKTNDVRFNAYFKDEPMLSAAGRNPRLIAKYQGAGTGCLYGNNAVENLVNAKHLRTGEMVLIRAEARAEQGKFSGPNSASSDMNMLRDNRIVGNIPVVYASQQAAIDDIIQERFKELAYEGHRFWDLKRRNLPVTRTGNDAPSAAGATLPAGNFRFVLPIPLPEIVSNPQMQQNPGYQ